MPPSPIVSPTEACARAVPALHRPRTQLNQIVDDQPDQGVRQALPPDRGIRRREMPELEPFIESHEDGSMRHRRQEEQDEPRYRLRDDELGADHPHQAANGRLRDILAAHAGDAGSGEPAARG